MKMKTSDLRPGNLVQDPHGNWVEVEKIPNQIQVMVNHVLSVHRVEYLEPIPLDQDILLDLGFTRQSENHFKLKDIRLIGSVDGVYQIEGDDLDLEYIHQLQNRMRDLNKYLDVKNLIDE
jgi:hypothetical protein